MESNLSLLENELILKQAGATTEQISAQKSQIEQAEANVLNIKAQLAKTIIKSPINGKIVTILPNEGEFLSAGQTIAHIINNRGRQVKTYLSIEDALRVRVGTKVIVEGDIDAIVSHISPGIDPNTQKIEVIITLISENKNIFVGQYVNISFNQKDEENNIYFLPLQSVKISSGTAYVYIVNSDSKLEETKVVIGSISDDKIEVIEGIESDMKILKSLRGFELGQKVIVK